MGEPEDRAVTRLLRAASARAGELPEASPFLVTRIRAALAARRPEAAHPFGAAAWQMLPALALLVALLSGWAGWQSYKASRQRDEALAALMDPSQGGDVFVAALLGGAPGAGTAAP